MACRLTLAVVDLDDLQGPGQALGVALNERLFRPLHLPNRNDFDFHKLAAGSEAARKINGCRAVQTASSRPRPYQDRPTTFSQDYKSS